MTNVRRSGGGSSAAVAVAIAAVLWGTTGIGATYAAPLGAAPFGTVAIGAAAMGIGGLALGLGNLRRIPAVFRTQGATRLVIAGAVAISVFALCFYGSMGLAGVAIGTIITICSAPIFAGLFELTIDRVRLTGRWYLASLLAIGGGVLLIIGRRSGGDWMGADPSMLPWGVLVGLGGGFTFALYAWLLGRLIKPSAGRPEGIDRTLGVAAILGTAAVPLLILMIITGGPVLLQPGVWVPLLYLGLIPMAIGHALFGWALAKLSASTVTLYTLLEPAVATLLAVWLVGERLSPGGWLGLGLVLVGLVVLSLPRRRFAARGERA